MCVQLNSELGIFSDPSFSKYKIVLKKKRKARNEYKVQKLFQFSILNQVSQGQSNELLLVAKAHLIATIPGRRSNDGVWCISRVRQMFFFVVNDFYSFSFTGAVLHEPFWDRRDCWTSSLALFLPNKRQNLSILDEYTTTIWSRYFLVRPSKLWSRQKCHPIQYPWKTLTKVGFLSFGTDNFGASKLIN